MPYIKPFKKTDELTLLIRGYYTTYTALAEVIGCDRETAKKKVENAGKLTVEDLRKLCRKGHIPADKLREAIEF